MTERSTRDASQVSIKVILRHPVQSPEERRAVGSEYYAHKTSVMNNVTMAKVTTTNAPTLMTLLHWSLSHQSIYIWKWQKLYFSFRTK